MRGACLQVLFDEFCRFYAKAASGQPVTIDAPKSNNQAQARSKPKQRSKPKRQTPTTPAEMLKLLGKNFKSVASGRGYIDSGELGLVLQRSGMSVTKAELLALYDALGHSDDGAPHAPPPHPARAPPSKVAPPSVDPLECPAAPTCGCGVQ